MKKNKLIVRPIMGPIASKEQLQQLNKTQTKLSALIEVGYISSYQDAKDYLQL